MKQLLDMNMGKNWELCIFFSPHEVNGKIIFMLGNFIIAELRVLQMYAVPLL